MRFDFIHLKRKPAQSAFPPAGEEHRGDLRVLSGDGSTTNDKLYFGRNRAGTLEFVQVGLTNTDLDAFINDVKATTFITRTPSGVITSEFALNSLASGVLTTDGSGNLSTTAHHTTSGTAPTIAKGANAGSTASVAIGGNDNNGDFSVTPGGASIAAGHLVTITFASAWPNTNYGVWLQESSAGAAGLGSVRITNRTTTSFQVLCASVPTSGTTYSYFYMVRGRA